eukprot:GEMP01022432.1.p1 GENE.GEMP01022432.1~~GEMP01022432.1.p1  ORF type:complete len:381 (+),score=117.39 GEMP01022432.1:95-1237(+)
MGLNHPASRAGLSDFLKNKGTNMAPPAIRMLDMMFGFMVSQMVYVAHKLNIAEHLSTGPKTADELSKLLDGVDPSNLNRLLNALCAHGVFELHGGGANGEPQTFKNNAFSAVLREDHPNSVKGMVGHLVEDTYAPWGSLLSAFQVPPKNPWGVVQPQYANFFDYLKARPASEKQFGLAMKSIDSLGVTAMVADAPFNKFDHVIDIGGSGGHLLHRILNAHPKSTGTLFDLPAVIKDVATPLWDDEFKEMKERVELKSGDFFELGSVPSPPATATKAVYVMRYILHDWDPESVCKILKNVRTAIGDTGASLLIGECGLPNKDKIDSMVAKYDIDMHMMALFLTAQERTPDQWRELLSKNSFEIVQIHSTRSLLGWVEAKPI